MQTTLGHVVKSGMCVSCGACTAADENLRLVLHPEELVYVPHQDGNENAVRVCPGVSVNFKELLEWRFPGKTAGDFGVVDSVMLAQSTDEKRNLAGSSGGIIGELLGHFLRQAEVDGVIALAHVKGLCHEPVLISQEANLTRLPGSIYHSVPFAKAFQLLSENEGRYVVVGIPCQLEGLYNYIFALRPDLYKRVYATVGLICGWYYTHHALRAICAYTGVEFDELQDVSYRGGGPVGKLRLNTGDRTVAVSRRTNFSYQAAFDRSYNIARCHVCVNHGNILADVAVGDAWLPSTLFTRAGISIVVNRIPQLTAVVRQLAGERRIVATDVTVDEIEESQTRRVAFGDFAYAYAEYLRDTGLHCPQMEAPNRRVARLTSRSVVARFHKDFQMKRMLQRRGWYRRLWWRKAFLESGKLSWKYLRWFGVRVLKLKAVVGVRKEVSSKCLSRFR